MVSGFDLEFQHSLARQSWTLYGVGMAVIVFRAFARWHRVRSFSLLAVDDWVMMTAVPAFYTMLVVCLNLIATGGGSNLYPPEQFDTFTPAEIEERIKGSKIVIVSEQAMLNVIWSLKVCMLFMFARMTVTTKYRPWVNYLAIYVGVGWVAVETAFFTTCRPFKGYWGMPPPDPQCTTLVHYAIVQCIFNLSSDIGMLLIPLPMVISLSLPLKQKLVLAVIFSMGIFVILAAILTKIYNLSDVYATDYMFWYTREASVAVYVANLPGIWPLLRERFRFLRNGSSNANGGSELPQYGKGGASRLHSRSRKSTTIVKDSDIEIGNSRRSFSKSTTKSVHSQDGGPRGRDGKTSYDEDAVGFKQFGRELKQLATMSRRSLDSDERNLRDESSERNVGGGGWGGKNGINLEVHVDRTIEVNRESFDASARHIRGPEGRYEWEVERQAPKVRIEGPDGEVLNK
ncbi:hypothetical protein BCR34DRAFT_617622 [Clohesyomyces aquaticus]|uniref:Rhodopsin domain-containing protein n=1 Tax=Clohesyomyces aquaticus TaxID=1231657 RepID=A0A1Y1Z1S1_9PLEO|nr:hypothetical protein BCR34DRAFT_617622 [Clohesyomyces aquaticus]